MTAAPRDKEQPAESWLCPACGAMMYPARFLKGYPKMGWDAERQTCALHGPLGQFHHIATDRAKRTEGTS